MRGYELTGLRPWQLVQREWCQNWFDDEFNLVRWNAARKAARKAK
jgi:hypothetical protein